MTFHLFSRLRIVLLGLSGLWFLSSCAVNPVTGKKQLTLMSEQQEIALGAESDPQIIAQFGLYEHPQMQAFIEQHGQEMAKISHRPDLKFQFRILDSPVVNAFAVPGGYVYFTRGIMAHFNNEAEFAGVLGHEIGHVTARHSVEQYTKATVAQVLLIGGMLLSKEVRAFANEAELGLQLLFLKYSRDNESQSDELGVEYSTKVGYDAREMAHFFQTIKSLSEGGGELPTFLSTHPDPLDRYAKVGEHAAKWQQKIPRDSYTINRDSYLRMINGLIYGEDPRQGYVHEGFFYHPELRFQYPVPTGWSLENSPSQVLMAPSDGKALMLLALAEGTDLQSAATSASSALELNVKQTRQISVNGLQGLEVIADQVNQDPSTGQQYVVKVQSVYIKWGEFIYVFHGVALETDFPAYDPFFDKTMYGFKELKDAARINVFPERIHVVEVKNAGTLGQVLNANGVPTTRHREMGIVNGMDVTDRVEPGQLIKIVKKDTTRS